MFRWPKQTNKFNKAFYQRSYIKLASDNMHLPTPEEAMTLLKSNFLGHPTALGIKCEIIKKIKPTGRLFVYGANWGYEVAQFAHAGYEAIGYEVSAPRAEFASKQLGVSVFQDIESIRAKGPYDIIYCSHTLEHLPTPEAVLHLFQNLCAETGCVVLFVPNCGGENARKQGVHWGPFSSSLHPLSYEASFFAKSLPNYGFNAVSTFSDPYSLESIEQLNSQKNPSGDELLVVASRGNLPLK